MAGSINNVTLIGRCGQDPQVKRLDSGSVVANFTVATSETWKDKSGEKKESTQWHNITCWGAVAEIAEKYVHKGDQLCVIGRLQYEQYEKEGVRHTIARIKADNLVLLGSKKHDQVTSNAPQAINEPIDEPDNDLPF